MNGHRIRPHSSKKGLNASSPRPACPWCGRPAGAAPRGIVVGGPNRTGRGAWTAGTGSRSRRRAWTMDTQNPSQHRSAAALLV
jgi:hypothetical protein